MTLHSFWSVEGIPSTSYPSPCTELVGYTLCHSLTTHSYQAILVLFSSTSTTRPMSLLFSFKKPIAQSLVSDSNHHKSRHLSRQIKNVTLSTINNVTLSQISVYPTVSPTLHSSSWNQFIFVNFIFENWILHIFLIIIRCYGTFWNVPCSWFYRRPVVLGYITHF